METRTPCIKIQNSAIYARFDKLVKSIVLGTMPKGSRVQFSHWVPNTEPVIYNGPSNWMHPGLRNQVL